MKRVPDHPGTGLTGLTAAKIVLIYVFFGVIWILTSDLLVSRLSPNSTIYTTLSIAKGWMFILATSVLLYLLIRRYAAERNEIEARLQEARARAELYLDLMGHDITNMNQAGIGFLELAQEQLKLSDEDRQLIAIPQHSLRNSTRLIEYVRKLQRASAGGALRPVDLGPALGSLATEYPAQDGRGITISYAGGSCHVMANDMLPDLFTGIIDSISRRSAGPAAVDVRLERTEAGGVQYCRVVFEGSGWSCPPQAKEALAYDRLKGYGKTVDRDISMYLVRELAENYRGSVYMEDRAADGQDGCRYVVLLPAIEK
ncbi:hypothetical protein MCP_0053 [Methanocella paludicola SANAE]|uniref:Histidine kinase domain-containing protein n=1 Tax=Methanocella paludicola (strain DSM 17711 / JCM 13418 / NBRC 101707 / SANAE) TaxID=304371 RepID=D1YUK3_METPS|nr:HAMP domain-containing histidine kinase [Methanocella paludicola]BAI60125.1 hypothetical protein MCP_0053 [Methanocella paludicola SANAE]